MSTLSDDDVRYVARLSKLELSNKEITNYKQELEAILAYIDKLQEIDTTDVLPTAQVTGLQNAMREDEVSDNQVSKKELLKNVPSTDADGHIKVKRVLT